MNYKVNCMILPENQTFRPNEVKDPVKNEEMRSLVEKCVDEDIAAFDTFFQKTLKNDPMLKSEKAMIKTYLAYKLGVVKTTAATTPNAPEEPKKVHTVEEKAEEQG